MWDDFTLAYSLTQLEAGETSVECTSLSWCSWKIQVWVFQAASCCSFWPDMDWWIFLHTLHEIPSYDNVSTCHLHALQSLDLRRKQIGMSPSRFPWGIPPYLYFLFYLFLASGIHCSPLFVKFYSNVLRSLLTSGITSKPVLSRIYQVYLQWVNHVGGESPPNFERARKKNTLGVVTQVITVSY